MTFTSFFTDVMEKKKSLLQQFHLFLGFLLTLFVLILIKTLICKASWHSFVLE